MTPSVVHAKLQTLHQFVQRVKGDTVHYVYADPLVCGCLYVGTQQAYDQYKRDQQQKNLALLFGSSDILTPRPVKSSCLSGFDGHPRTLMEVGVGSLGGSLRGPGRAGGARQQTHWPWMRGLQVLDDDAGLDDVALAVDQQRELAQRPAVYDSPLAFEWRLQAPAGRGSVKTQNQFHGFQFWQFLINQYAQNRTTIGLFALFCAPKLSVTSFYTASANCGP